MTAAPPTISSNHRAILSRKLDTLKAQGNYRHFLDIRKSAQLFPRFFYETRDGGTRSAVNWCSNDYLGMSTDEEIIGYMTDTTFESGTGSGGTRNISGTTVHHKALEQTVATLHHKQAGLIFNSAYLANLTAISTLGRAFEHCVFISDEENHASIIEGIRLSRCEKHIFRHNDVKHLEEILESLGRDTVKIVVFESVYSISGTVAPIKAIAQMAKKYDALTYIDEVHAVGLYGEHGEGMVAQQHCEHLIDVVNGTFAKAFGVIGGYVAADAIIIDYIRSFGEGFIFTTSLPPSVCKAAIESIEKVKSNRSLRNSMHQKVKSLRNALRKYHIPFDDNESHITRIPIGDSLACKNIADRLLLEHGVYLQPVNPPTVKKGGECLRITVSAKHDENQILHLAKALAAELHRKDDLVNERGSSSFLFFDPIY